MLERPDRMLEPLWRMAPPREPKPRPLVLPLLAWLLVIAAVISLVVWAAPVRAEPVSFECRTFAPAIAGFTDFRDTGARLELVIKMARQRNPQMTRAHMAVVERELRRLWQERLTRDQAELRLYERCVAQMGDMGRDT